MRVIGGVYGGQRLTASSSSQVRPTSDKVREAVFDILEHRDWVRAGSVLKDARVLDACCGTGALGIEALSRGAAHASFADNAQSSLRTTHGNLAGLSIPPERFHLIRTDILKIPPAAQPCQLIFLDPPYRQDIPARVLPVLMRQGWLADGAMVVVETAALETLPLPPGLELRLDRRYGDTRIHIISLIQSEETN